jgi:hypothetical protein
MGINASRPFFLQKPGIKNSPSPTPPFFLLASLTKLLIKLWENSTCLTNSSGGTDFITLVKAALLASRTSSLSSTSLFNTSLRRIGTAMSEGG